MNIKPRVGTHRALVTVTSATPQAIIAPQSGIAPSVFQLCMHETNGSTLRSVTIMEETREIFTFTLAASGTIIWDMPVQEELQPGSGLYAKLDGSGGISVLARYYSVDERTPTNLNPSTYRPRAIRTPNFFGGQ